MTVAEVSGKSTGLARDDRGEADILAEPTDNPSPHTTVDDLWRAGMDSRVVDGPDFLDGTRGPDEDPAWFDTDEFRALEERVLWRSCVSDSIRRAHDEVAGLAAMSTSLVTERLTDTEAVDLARQLEELSCSLVAAQARVAVVVDAQTRAQQADCGVPAAKRGVGVAAQLGLARRDSHARARNRLALAKDLINELPETMRALTAGVTTEYRASLVARATAVLDPDTRRGVDAIIGPELKDLSDRAVDSRARALAYQADPHAFAAASERSAEERYVGIRPAPTTMARVTGFLPAPEGVACYAALDSAARAAQAAGDERTLAQLRADIFAERITGRHPLIDGPDIEVGIIITDHTLLGDHPPAEPTAAAEPTESGASAGSTESAEAGEAATAGESSECAGARIDASCEATTDGPSEQ
ncbi:MAG: DUF222 domain-containing protein, partial [Mobilicoccus sp.]|nr:DUF222 domain-containing protein [Mobilicoccus sp.]